MEALVILVTVRRLALCLLILTLLNPGLVRAADQGKILFTSDRDGGYGIYIIDADGSNLLKIVDETSADGTTAWSPDGKTIAYVSRGDGLPQIYTVNGDGSNPRRLSKSKTQD